MTQRQELSTSEIEALLERPTLTYRQAAQILGVGETNFRKAMTTNALLPLQSLGGLGKRKLISTASLKRLLA